MQIPDFLDGFLRGPTMILVGSRNAANIAEVGRAVGVWIGPGASELDLLISRWQWPDTIANLVQNGASAVTVSRPTDYTTYQFKGRATLKDPVAEDLMLAAQYIRMMSDCLVGLGVERAVMASFLCDRDLLFARLSVDEIFVQTPGPSAGTAVGLPT